MNKLIRDGADVDCADGSHFTALHHAALSGFEDTVSTLLKAGADVNALAPNYGSPLYLAALKARENVFEILLASRASLGPFWGAVGSIVHVAAVGNSVRILQLLYERDVPLDDERLVCVEMLFAVVPLERTRDNYSSRLVSTPHEKIAVLRWPEALTSMIGVRPLDLAALYGHMLSFRWLIDHGVRFDVPLQTVENSFTLTALAGNPYCMALLTNEFHSEVDCRNSDDETALMIASELGNKEVVEVLLKAGASVSFQDRRGSTAIHDAAIEDHRECLKLLIEAPGGGDALTVRYRNKTPFEAVASGGSAACKRILLEKHAQLKCPVDKTYGIQALHSAARDGDARSIRLLAQVGVDVNERETRSTTALFIAIQNNNTEAAQELIDLGVATSREANDGLTAMQLALTYENDELVRLLKERDKRQASTSK